MNLLSPGISNFPDSSVKRKDFLDTLAADFVAACQVRSYPERNPSFGSAMWTIRVFRECCTRC